MTAAMSGVTYIADLLLPVAESDLFVVEEVKMTTTIKGNGEMVALIESSLWKQTQRKLIEATEKWNCCILEYIFLHILMTLLWIAIG